VQSEWKKITELCGRCVEEKETEEVVNKQYVAQLLTEITFQSFHL
jgi:hypothetical protein